MNLSKQLQQLQNNALNKCVIEAQKSRLNHNYTEVTKIHAIALINNQKNVFGFQSGSYLKIENLQELQNFTNYFID
jgi:hypothetical protein